MKTRLKSLVALVWLLQGGGCAHRAPAPTASESAGSRFAVAENAELRASHEAHAARFMVTTSGPLSSLAAREIFAKGGNVADAAVAASFALAVERPHSTGLGGGGFLLYRSAKAHKVTALDFREKAPAKATKTMYLDAKGDPIPEKSIDGPLSAGVPGFVAGLVDFHKRNGKLPLAVVLAPAIRIAEDGFAVYANLAKALDERKDVLARYPSSRAIFLNAAGAPLREGQLLVQKDLAKTLRMIAKHGAAGFYQGPVAEAIVRENLAQGGVITRTDLESYNFKWREPVRGTFRGYSVTSMPPPSSGGIHVIEILNILSALDPDYANAWNPQNVHKTAVAMQFAFADRAKHLGDPDFVKVPEKGLTSKAYALSLAKTFDAQHAFQADHFKGGDPLPYESSDTTHLTVADAEGNVVSSTQTINGYMGSAFVVAGTGVVLNNEMDDFSAKAGAQNLFGAVGGDANAIVAAKRPLSSMSPTIIEKDGELVMALGAPGGTRILTCVALTTLNYLGYKMPLYESVSSLRFHHQWKPDEIQVEQPGFEAPVAAKLKALGYQLKLVPPQCRVTAIAKENDELHGVADPRDVGAAVGL
jgi:gamma-glutamyltranspeptidase/glutathione hydrolase